MPGAILDPIPVGVFPFALSLKFASKRTFEGRQAEYHDGTTERALLVGNPRRTWSMSKRLTAAEALALRDWWDAYQASTFYFYDLRETSPPFSWDASGSSTAGRYIVRFNSDWSATMSMPRSDVNVELIEVGGGASLGTIIPGSGGIPAIHGLPVAATMYFTTSYIPGTGYSSVAAANLGSGLNLFDGSSYSDRTDAAGTWSSGVWSAAVGPFATVAYPPNTNVSFWIDGTIGGTASPPAKMYIHDCWMTVTYADGTAITYRPTKAATIVNLATGTITGPNNAIGGNLTTYCEIDRFSFGGGSRGCQLVLSKFA